MSYSEYQHSRVTLSFDLADAGYPFPLFLASLIVVARDIGASLHLCERY